MFTITSPQLDVLLKLDVEGLTLCMAGHSICGFLLVMRNVYVLLLQVDPASAGVQYDKDFVVCSLDLLSGLTEGLGSGIESLVLFSPFNYIF